jgi:hypothetical protein
MSIPKGKKKSAKNQKPTAIVGNSNNSTYTEEVYPAWAMAYFGVACVSVVTFYWASEGCLATAALREWATQIGFLALLAWRVRSLPGDDKDRDDSGRLDRLSLYTTNALAHLAHWLYIACQSSDVCALLFQPACWVLTGALYSLCCFALRYVEEKQANASDGSEMSRASK